MYKLILCYKLWQALNGIVEYKMQSETIFALYFTVKSSKLQFWYIHPKENPVQKCCIYVDVFVNMDMFCFCLYWIPIVF
jgi:hypothetical protein